MLILMLLTAGALLLFLNMKPGEVQPGKKPGEPSLIAVEPPVLKKLVANKPAPDLQPVLLKPEPVTDPVIKPAPQNIKPLLFVDRKPFARSVFKPENISARSILTGYKPAPDRIICKTR